MIQNNIDTTPVATQILKSIRENKAKEAQELEVKVQQASRSWIGWILSFFFKPTTLDDIRKAKLAELRNPREFSSMKKLPSIQTILNKLDASSNYFSSNQQKYIENLERFHFPQMGKVKVGYELLEHMSNRLKESESLPKMKVTIGSETFEVLDGKKLQHPIFVHATRMSTAPLILNNLSKFFNDNIKLSLSLFDSGKMFFHSNDPKPREENPFPTSDFYVALGLSVDPKNFYRNYHQDVGSPTYNSDPQIATKGGNDRIHVETHIKMNKILGLLGTYVQDVFQRTYEEIGADRSKMPYSDTDRIFRLERETHWSADPSEPKIKQQMVDELARLRGRTGHTYAIRHSLNGMITGEIVFNIMSEIKELVHLKDTKPISPKLKEEIENLHRASDKFWEEHDKLHLFYNSMSFKIKSFLSVCFSPLYSIPTFRKLLFPYHIANFASHRMIRFLGANELLRETPEYSYNEFEAHSHEASKKLGARPISIKCIAMSRNAFDKLKNATEEQQNQFKALAKTAREKQLPIVIVDTYVSPDNNNK